MLTLTMQRSSQGEQSKYSILVNELARRFEVMAVDVSIEEKIAKIYHFTQQLVNSGYGYKQSREIVVSMLKGMKRKEEKRKRQEKRYLSAQDTLAERNLSRLMENTNWYKEKETRDAEKTSSFNFEMFGDNEKGCWKEKTQSWKGWRRNKNIKKKVGEKMEDTRNKLQ